MLYPFILLGSIPRSLRRTVVVDTPPACGGVVHFQVVSLHPNPAGSPNYLKGEANLLICLTPFSFSCELIVYFKITSERFDPF